MAIRRERSENFVIGRPNSPHVLDLREYIKANFPQEKKRRITRKLKRKKVQSPVPEMDDALMQEMVLRELAKIENHDVQLALRITEPKNSISEDPIVGELADFGSNSYDPPMATLARGLMSDAPPLLTKERGVGGEVDDLVSSFFQKTKDGQSHVESSGSSARQTDLIDDKNLKFYLEKSRVFIALAALISGFLFGGFFVQKGIALKEGTIEKGLSAYNNFASAQDALKHFQFSAASKNFAQAYENLVSAEEEISKIGATTLAIAKNLPFESRADSSLALLTAAKHVSRAGEVLSSAFTFLPMDHAVSAGAFLSVLTTPPTAPGTSGETGYLVETFDAFVQNLTSAERELLAAEKAIKKVRAEDFPKEFQDNIAKMNEQIPVLRDLVGTLKDYSAVSSLLLGKDGHKRYLILLQNSSELRATGGFIGTYALVEVENGGLQAMRVEGIYDADGQLAVNVVPPKPFQHIATGWSAHDANWFLDFPSSAKKVAWFFERTGNGKVDGVMTLNIEVIERLLALTGPIEVKQYGLTLNAENFRDEIQYEVEVAYDKRLNKPKKVLADFTPLFLEKLFISSKEKNKEFISILINALEEKYIMLYFNDERVQAFFDTQGWSGRIEETRNNKHETSSDFLAIAHSNIGGHKTDKYMADKVGYDVEMKEDGSIIGNLFIQRKHNGGSSKYWWYNRKNIDYVKIYAPKGSEVISASGGVRRKADAPDYKKLGFTRDADISAIENSTTFFGPIDVFEESGKTVFGTWLVTDPRSSSELKIGYKLPFATGFTNGAAKYNLFWQKQPGTNILADFSIRMPKSWRAIWDNAETKNLEQSFTLDRDRVIGYIFSK